MTHSRCAHGNHSHRLLIVSCALTACIESLVRYSFCACHIAPVLDVQAISSPGVPHILSSLVSRWHLQSQNRLAGQVQHLPWNLSRAAVLKGQQSEQLRDDRNAVEPAVQPGEHNSKQGSGDLKDSLPQQQQQPCAGFYALLPSQQQQLQRGSALLWQVPVDLTLTSTFGDLFQWLLEREGMLCCGLYRQAAIHGAPVPYVYTNPHKVGD